jgi:hypothetical protein
VATGFQPVIGPLSASGQARCLSPRAPYFAPSINSSITSAIACPMRVNQIALPM